MNKDQRLLEEAYNAVYKGSKEPLYFGLDSSKKMWLSWLDHMKHEVHEDGSITVEGDISFRERQMTALPFKFKKAEGHFDCSKNKLESLENCPEIVQGSFACNDNRLTSLKGAPKSIAGNFNCSSNLYLRSLEGCPSKIYGFFNCFHCSLSSFEGGPKIVKGNFHAGLNNIRSLKGAPEVIEGRFHAEHFSDQDYRDYIKKMELNKKIDKELSKDFTEEDLKALEDF